MTVTETLAAAVNTGEILRIAYYGGSNPGSVREIYPIRVAGGQVMARCIEDGSTKVFNIDKISLPDFPETVNDSMIYQIALPTTIPDAIAPYIEEMQAIGWHIKVSEEELGAYLLFKNGKLRKTPTTGIRYFQEHSRPYYTFGPDLVQARTYSNLAKAVATFVDQARRNAPIKKSGNKS